ncbi:MAG: IclR family transcriptional regulator [Kiritimatiellaeota bacterium]|nr:IclR family transcriptional regulator [Kiritimatiellota bacterium]
MSVNKAAGRNKYAVPAVEQMLDIVEHLAGNHRGYGITELARALGISTNGVFRILKCLTERGYAEADPQGGHRLGTKFFTLGMQLQSRFDLRRRARPHLERLCEQSGETVQLYALQDDHALVLDCVTPAASSFIQVLPGSRMASHASAFSKAVLAFLPEKEVLRRLPRKLDALTPHTVTDKKKLGAELARTRTTGLAYDREGYMLGIFCIGAPVFDVNGEAVAGVGVTGLVSVAHPEKQVALEHLILTCAERLSRDIGYAGGLFGEFRTRLKGKK